MSSDIKKNPSATKDLTGTLKESSYSPGKDLEDSRKATLGDYLKALTSGNSTGYIETDDPSNPNPISGNKVSIDATMRNHYPIDTDTTEDISVSSGNDSLGLPSGITNITDTQTHFIAMNAAKDVFNQISSGIFCPTKYLPDESSKNISQCK